MRCFVLAKNEGPNIGRCLSALTQAGLLVHVLDSGSSDDTMALAESFANVEVETYQYENHCKAYNYITGRRAVAGEYVMVIDADMIVSARLWAEIESTLESQSPDVIISPIEFHVEGVPMRWGSLCPPKPIVFRGGEEYFVPAGHGERLRAGLNARTTENVLAHDDQKPYSSYLMSQCRYTENFIARLHGGSVSRFDRIRKHSPLMMIISPMVSLFIRAGILAGRSGIVYAMDRLIAESIKYRQIQAEKLRQKEKCLNAEVG